MSEWQPIETAPRDGTVFLAVNHDGEVWVSKFADERDPRLLFRTNRLQEPRSFRVHEVAGKRLLEEDTEFAKKNEHWSSAWTYWTRGYEFKPVSWLPLLPPPPLPCPPSR